VLSPCLSLRMCQLRRVMKKLTHLCSRQEPEEGGGVREEGEGKGEGMRGMGGVY